MGGCGLVSGLPPSLRLKQEGCQLVSPPQQVLPRTTSVSPCVFILSINGIFSNGDWEMDLVFKKICGF